MTALQSSLLAKAPLSFPHSRVIRKRSTEEFSCVPYIIVLLNCLIYTWYGLSIISKEWENFPVVTINGLGVVLEFTFIPIYILFTSNKNKTDETGCGLGGGSIGVQCDRRSSPRSCSTTTIIERRSWGASGW
ncbi:hypothetical protein MLD38_030425 [Melastoma candidum]|uniref:Uncharacterized protein n=1 Tax=Melastoma candidum TaxID=119954 RepID=A0ACB9ML50_9MYRT|nr:hypothetical protein MLD38_030425 [Melastoma candidum]